MLLYGTVTDKGGSALSSVLVEVKNSGFETIYSAQTDELGHYEIDLPAGLHPFVTAVRDYAETYLEYWCHNLTIRQDMELNIKIDTLEIYGLNYFRIAGAFPALMVYFRPMSLQKFLSQTENIAPDINTMKFSADGNELSVLKVNQVEEFIGDCSLCAYLIQIEEPASNWNKLELEISDFDGNYGSASIFRS